MTKMIVVAENEKGALLAKWNHRTCFGTGVQGHQLIAGKKIPILCKCAKFVPKKEGKKNG